MIRRILAAVVTLALAALLLVMCWPQLFGLERVLGVAQLVSLRGLAAFVTLLVAVLLTLIALLSPAGRRFFAGLAVLLLAFSVVSIGVLAVRGFGNGALQTTAPGDVVVVSWNTLGDAPGAETIAALALEQEADVVALPETSEAAADEIAALMAASGRPMQVLGVQFDDISKARSTRVLISTDLGEYTRDETVGNTPTLPSVVARPRDPGRPPQKNPPPPPRAQPPRPTTRGTGLKTGEAKAPPVHAELLARKLRAARECAPRRIR